MTERDLISREAVLDWAETAHLHVSDRNIVMRFIINMPAVTVGEIAPNANALADAIHVFYTGKPLLEW